MTTSSFTIRYADSSDAQDIALILRKTQQHALAYLPNLHTPEQDLSYIQYIILVQDTVAVAEMGGKIVGFCAFRKGIIDHLYVIPEHQGKGIGSALIQEAKQQNVSLELWVFQKNLRAQEFYKLHGFVMVEETDGSGNEEGVPDARYVWRKE